jgi:hypothetical protein
MGRAKGAKGDQNIQHSTWNAQSAVAPDAMADKQSKEERLASTLAPPGLEFGGILAVAGGGLSFGTFSVLDAKSYADVNVYDDD